MVLLRPSPNIGHIIQAWTMARIVTKSYYTYVLNMFGVMNTLVVSTCQPISKKLSLGTIIPFKCVTVCVCVHIYIVYECTRYFETTNQSYQRFMSSTHW